MLKQPIYCSPSPASQLSEPLAPRQMARFKVQETSFAFSILKWNTMKKTKTNFFLKSTNKQKAPKKMRQEGRGQGISFFLPPARSQFPGQESIKPYPLDCQRIPRIQLLKEGHSCSGQKLVRTDQVKMVLVSTSWTLSILTDSLLHISIHMNTPIRAMTVLRSTIKDQRVGGGPISKNLCSFPTKKWNNPPPQ